MVFVLQCGNNRSFTLKGCSHGTIVTVIYFSQLIGRMGYCVAVAITPLNPIKPIGCDKNSQWQSHRVRQSSSESIANAMSLTNGLY